MNLISEIMLIVYGVGICIISFLLLLLVRKADHTKKMMFINESVRTTVNINALIFSSYYFVFIEPGSEYKLEDVMIDLRITEGHSNVLIVYCAPEWRANMLKKKMEQPYSFYIDESKQLASLLGVQAYPSVLSVHYPSNSIKKIM
ncbi:hypothetical protein NQ117_00860 [Paenibacillus sp. SC116]|uniref:hypothetical protein n=1 Tax=Paenibacillus sp. SC116 TaxID=2968986 RepID=UPI00215A2897|nr:hypothetical protein [Paenibacillus sp. SC116]MCR8842223.1 hypothetical protein [Paenibacillus sp. SC116]